jgi:hypothetical protein
MGLVMPGARIKNIMPLANKEISKLDWNDFVGIRGGVNDINKN